jgi:two-component system, LytTR family, sensor kinase
MPFAEGAARRLLIQIVVSVILLSPILFMVDVLSPMFFTDLEFMTPQFKSIMYMVFVLVIAMINLSFYGSFFFRQWKDSIEEKARLQVQAADAEKNKAMAQYHHLKNQVNHRYIRRGFEKNNGHQGIWKQRKRWRQMAHDKTVKLNGHNTVSECARF